ncbi:MAG: DUF2339 domain-containing protein [Kiloniellales bacterium]|nr:DUF2339 domain-containing protein [Kiloniellales bacterium]
MEAMLGLLAIVILGYLFIAPIFGIIAHSGVGRSETELRSLRNAVARLGEELAAARKAIEALQNGAPPASPAQDDAPRPAPEAPSPAPPPDPGTPPREEAPQESPPEPARPVAPPPAAAARAPDAGKRAAPAESGFTRLAGLEESLASRWLVWVGALALALGGAFLVKVSIERGWLGPGLRVTLGFLFGLACVGAGEWLRRRPLQKAIASLRPDYVPPALAGAGLFIAFASLYAAYALYGFLGPVTAFIALAAVALGGIALSLLQGPVIALIGLTGGFATPLLVSTGTPQPWPLFTYLLVISAAALGVVRYKDWWWLAWATLGGSFGWALLWLLTTHVPGQTLPLGLYILATTVVSFFVRAMPPEGAEKEESLLEVFLPLAPPARLFLVAASAAAALLWGLVQSDDHGNLSLAFAAVAVAGSVLVAWRFSVLQPVSYLGTLLALALLATWPLSYSGGGPVAGSGLRAMAMIFGLILGGGGFAVLWGARRPDVWAAFSASSSFLILVVIYWRVGRFEADLPWAGVALVLAALSVGAASLLARYRDRPGYDGALGVYAACCFAAIGLGTAIGLERAWLTVGLALQLPALAWVALNLRIHLLRNLAWVAAATVLVRLLANPEVLSYPLGTWSGFTWVLYGYGLPAVAFFFAAWWFRKQEDGPLVMLLEAGCIAFGVLLISFEIRTLLFGALDHPRYGLLEQSLHSIAWLSVAYGLAQLNARYPRKVMEWAWVILVGLAALQIAGLQVIVDNPLWSGEAVGDWPLLNVLLLAYAAPAAFALLFVPVFRRSAHPNFATPSGIAALVLTFFYVSLEVRRAFQGPDLSLPGMTDGELYAYSLVWLVYAAGLLGFAFLWSSAVLRYASLAIVLLAVGKVFLIDMAELTGLLRALSFAGLGLALIGIGIFYQRVVFAPQKPREAV